MVLDRHIEKLKERPHHERRAVALTIAIGVVIVLFVAWAFIFFTEMHANEPIQAPASDATTTIITSTGTN